MYKVGRNDPCPCGSGLKYKKCCLEKERSAAALSGDEHAAVATAIAWLKANYEEEVDDAIVETYLGGIDQEELDAVHALPPGPKGMLEINIGEWLVCDAVLEVEGKRVRAVDLALGSGGPLLTAHGKEWVKAIGENPLSLYEVQAVTPGEELEVKDLLQSDAPVVKVTERSASRTLVKWDIFGARIARRPDGHVFTGAIYPMDRQRAHKCLEEILDELAREKTADDEICREVVGTTIADYWLEQFTEEPHLPQVVHASTGEPISLTVDRYTVTGWDALTAILSAQPDVDGDIGEGWTRFEPMKNQMRRSRASLTKKSPDTLEVFCPTLKLADDARQWLKKIAGTAIRFKAREIVDPMSPKAMAAARRSPREEIPSELK
ncbi:MAG: SEC-C metal-binding domain-containing protein, partial [Candidatus Deferrimicrobium sp.]